MQLFNTIISDTRQLIADWSDQQAGGPLPVRKFEAADHVHWPAAGNRDIVFQSDTGVELGNPKDKSVAFLAWTDDAGQVHDNRITLVGPDIGEIAESSVPFGKVVLIHGSGFTEDNCYERFREMDLCRFDVSLKGYMMRAVSQYMREWSRISREAVKNGLNFEVLGSAMLRKLKEYDYIKAAEIIFVTASPDHVRQLGPMADRFMQYINAMTKMHQEMDFDCDSCEYQNVCDEAEELRSMREKLMDKKESSE
ncbi:MAG: hypothetical protein SWH68_10055 [Thermodesulfobacteriota bacterium]|nr:hypothetical protein [Thermodesulfobacteriota bacterium]